MDQFTATELMDALNHTLEDYKNEHHWKNGKPTKPGTYVVEIEQGMVIVVVTESSELELVPIKRHLKVN
jgi:hypothetical protein